MITVELTATMPEIYEFAEHGLADSLEQVGSRKLIKIPKWGARRIRKHVVHEVNDTILYVEREPAKSSFLIGAWIIPKRAWYFYMDSKMPLALYGVRVQQTTDSIVELAIDNMRDARKHGIFPASIEIPRSNMRLLIKIVAAIVIVILTFILFIFIILMIGLLGVIVYDMYKNKRQRIYEKETMGIIAGLFVLEFNKDSTLLDSHMASRKKWWLRSALHEILNFLNPFQPG